MLKNRHFTEEQKAIILREYRKEKLAISQIVDKFKISPQLICNWEKQVWESAPEILSAKPGRPKDFSKQQKKIDELSALVQKKDAIIAHIVNDNLTLKKILGRSDYQLD